MYMSSKQTTTISLCSIQFIIHWCYHHSAPVSTGEWIFTTQTQAK